MWGTRRVGPDLSREGGRRGNDWHAVHFFDRNDLAQVADARVSLVLTMARPTSRTNAALAIITYVQWLGSWLDEYPYYEELAELTVEEE